jgi:hypothetical protein
VSTTGTPPLNILAGAVRALVASVAIMAVIKPAPPEQSKLVAGRKEATAFWVQGPNNMHFLL